MQKYGLLGRNISYSLSPAMHTAAFKALGMDAEYGLFDISAEGLEDFFSKLRKGEISGCNVTLPYKEKALKFTEELTAAAKAIGALNTISYEGGALKGCNTDYQGFIKALCGFDKGDLNFNVEQKSAFVFGAGGAARAVVYGLVTLGAKKIIIADIDTQKAEKLAGAFSQKRWLSALITIAQDKTQYNDFISKADLIVNATPCGAKAADRQLFDYKYIDRKHYVFDLIYAEDTALIKEARARGASVSGGLNMLLYQAARSFEQWTNKDAPLGVMREALLAKIKK